MSKVVDITGNRYDMLVVLGLDHVEKGKNRNKYYYKCKCDCGNICIRTKHTLHTKGEVHSCGCYQIKCVKENPSAKRHGDSKTRFYNIYHNAKSRCNNPNDAHYKHYGGKGIKFLWESYEEFKKDMYDSYIEHVKLYGEKETTIDRIDVSKNYYKENCRWATRRLQVNNRSTTVYVEMENNTLCPLSVFSEKCNIPINTLRTRYRKTKYYGTHRIPVNEILNDDELKLIKDKDIV